MDSSNAHVFEEEDVDRSFYGVFVETEMDDSGTPKVFTKFKETLSAVKSNKTARFKLFKSASEAERFSIFGQESPVKQSDKNTPAAVSSSFSFKSLKSEELVAFRRLIEGGELDKVKEAVNSNPRFLVSSGDTPSIIQEGCRYNAMHVAARYNQPEIVHFIMECVTSSDFIQSLYGIEQSYLSRSEIITDLYLNTPDKAANDTPLHIASKFGHLDVVKELVSYDKCILTSLNKYGQTPKDVICSRKNKEVYNDILNLLENGYFVPMWKSDDDCIQSTIGKPFSPKSSTIFSPPQSVNSKSLNPILEIRAVAGPMNETQAQKFWRDWKSPVRKSLLSPSPKKCSPSFRQKKFNDKSIEKTGRELAEMKKVGWAEYWPFLDQIVDLKSERGLVLLEKYLRKRFSSKEQDGNEQFFVPEPTSLLSPMGELCKQLESMRIGNIHKEKSPRRRSTLVSYTCLVKSCKVLGERLSKVIISECKDLHGIDSLASQLCHEIRHLLVLEDSFYSDNRFDSNIQGKIHGRVAINLCQLLVNNTELVVDISSVVNKLQKYYACHAAGSRSEITASCLVSLMFKIFHEKLHSLNCMQSIDNEESCKQWFLTADPCLCNIDAKPRLKPKQLFWNDESIKPSDNTEESKNYTLHNNMGNPLTLTNGRRDSISNGNDSDEDIFTSAPSSPCSEHSSSDESNMFYNAEHNFSYLLFSRDVPTDDDYEIFEAFQNLNIDSNMYPWLYRWLYSMNDYIINNNLNNL